MKLSTFKTAVLAGLIGLGSVGTAHAVNLNPEGLGQVLFYPYYTVNADNDTLISLTNTTNEAKAVKVRFMESQGSREVLDFNLYLSPKDVWAAGISMNDGVPTLYINDTSCTTPYLYEMGPQEFLPYALDEDNNDISRTSEGHIEVIEMGTVVGESAIYATHVTERIIDDVVVPLDRPEPYDCGALSDAWTYYSLKDDGYWVLDPHTDMEAPSGGLFGSSAIVNVSEGVLFSTDAYAINGFADEVGELHQRPGTILPSLNSGNIKTAEVFVDGQVFSSTEFARGVDAVSFVFMQEMLMNAYNINDIMAAETEWVITFPTKSFYTDDVATTLPVILEDEIELPQAIPPFTAVWDGFKACEPVNINSLYDREEQTLEELPGEERPPLVSPSLPVEEKEDPAFELCYETNVISFGAPHDGPSTIFGSSNVTFIDPNELGFQEGWMSLDFYNMPEDEIRKGLGGLAGLPAVGFSASRYTNYYADPGVRAHYNHITTHKGNRALDCEYFEVCID